MPMSPDHLHTLITQAFPDALIELQDTRGDNDHYTAKITSEAFRGKNRIQQHQMVYDALKGHMGTTLHALALKTQPPMEP